jgi:hypothetical protein
VGVLSRNRLTLLRQYVMPSVGTLRHVSLIGILGISENCR